MWYHRRAIGWRHVRPVGRRRGSGRRLRKSESASNVSVTYIPGNDKQHDGQQKRQSQSGINSRSCFSSSIRGSFQARHRVRKIPCDACHPSTFTSLQTRISAYNQNEIKRTKRTVRQSQSSSLVQLGHVASNVDAYPPVSPRHTFLSAHLNGSNAMPATMPKRNVSTWKRRAMILLCAS